MASRWLFIILCCLGRSGAVFLNTSNARELEMESQLLRLINRLSFEEDFNTLLIYGKKCVFHSVLEKYLRIPTVIVAPGGLNYDWNFSDLTLILTCGTDADTESTNSSQNLLKLQRNRRLIYIEEDTQPGSVCDKYSLKEQHNIAMVKSDFDLSNAIYSCRYYRTPNYEEINMFELDKSIYIENFRNMQGDVISTVPNLMKPRSMMYVDEKSGQLKMLGYVANLINTYVEKLNASLEFLNVSRLNIEKASTEHIAKWAEMDLLDIGTSLSPSLIHKNLDIITYPYLLTAYCLMIPIPASVPFNLVYSMIVDPVVLSIIFVLFCVFSILIVYTQNLSWRDLTLANVLLNDISLRGLLGQSFPFPANPSKHLKVIFFILCFASLMITTMYESYLQSFFARPPSQPYIRSFLDIGNFSHMMAISGHEVEILLSTNNTHFQEISKSRLVIYNDWLEYLRLRDSFNTSYIFPITVDRWECYEEQQKFFAHPAFYLDYSLCFNKFIYFSIPLRRHLPHRHLFEVHMMRQHEFGMVKYWKGKSFLDMVRLGRAVLKDFSQTPESGKALLIDDISWILKLYLIAMGISVCCFLLEFLRCGEMCSRWWRCRK
ncbi:hypothetical protein KR009_000644 [Drosophila setifemur]|nr:hypothetical protein KR009_000644 [Drosophila setifemur]